MNATRQPRWIPALVLAVAVASLLFAVTTWRDTPGRLNRIARRHADWERLHVEAQRIAADRAALADRTRSGAAPPLAEWLRAQRPDWKSDVREKDRERVTADWSIQRMQVTLDDVNLADMGATIDALTSARPGWRAAEITITAAESAPGRGRVTLILEGLVRTPAAGS